MKTSGAIGPQHRMLPAQQRLAADGTAGAGIDDRLETPDVKLASATASNCIVVLERDTVVVVDKTAWRCRARSGLRPRFFAS